MCLCQPKGKLQTKRGNTLQLFTTAVNALMIVLVKDKEQ